MPNHQRRKRRHTLGQGLVELAVVLPTLLLILMGSIDLGRVFYAYTSIGNAAYQAARQGARGGFLTTPCKNPAANPTSCDANEMKNQLCPATDTTYVSDAIVDQTANPPVDSYRVDDLYSFLRCELGGLFQDNVTAPSACTTAQIPNPTVAYPQVPTSTYPTFTPPVGSGCIGWYYNVSTDQAGAQEVTVTVTYNFSFLTPILALLNGTNTYLTIARTVSIAILTDPNANPTGYP